ncbi:MAG: arginyltransferase [Desulfomonile tiedjei]|nr:arginyltransferase [Desulfomonile tiedjei]
MHMDITNPNSRSAATGGRISSLFSPHYGTIPLDFLMAGDVHACPYLPGRDAREEFFLAEAFPSELYHDFMDQGFRRSGQIFYRPICDGCWECRPIRVPAATFKPDKSQRRVLRKNAEVEVRVGAPRFSKEKFSIYSDYLLLKHGTLPDRTPEYLKESLYLSPVKTIEFEYRVRGRLVGVGIADLCSRSLSSVYMFYDPDCAYRSLGTFSAIQEIWFCTGHSIPYYYLGFFVSECSAMSYKQRFRPNEILDRSCNWISGQDGEAGGATKSAGRSFKQRSGLSPGKD